MTARRPLVVASTTPIDFAELVDTDTLQAGGGITFSDATSLTSATHVVLNNQSNVYSTGTQDLSAATAFRAPLTSDPSSTAGALWVNSGLGKFWDNTGTPVKRTIATIEVANAWTASQTPSAAGGSNLGSAALPWGNAFLGSVASQAASFDTSSLTANRTIKVPDAAVVIPQAITGVAHQVLTALNGTTGVFTQVQLAFTDISGSITLAQMPTEAQNTVLGSVSVGSTVPVALTATQLTTIPNVFTSSLQGVTPASGGGTTNFLRADGTWAAPPGGGGGPTFPDVFSYTFNGGF